MPSPENNIIFVAYQSKFHSNGGMESATRIFESLHKRFGWVLLTNRRSFFVDRWRAHGAKVSVCDFEDGILSLMPHALSKLRWPAAIAGQLLLRRPKLIHVNDIRAYQAASVSAKLLGIPLIFTIRDTKGPNESYGALWRRAARQSVCLVTLSDEMKQIVCTRVGVSRDKVRVINSIVDLATFVPLEHDERQARRSKLGILKGQVALGVVGAVQEKKEQLAFIENSLPRVLASNESVHIHFLGDCDAEGNAYATLCLNSVKRLGISERVSFHGHTGNIAEWYPALDGVVLASRREGLARCMIEAMACGVPVVSFAVCSATEMLELTGAGVVVPLGDHEALTSAILDVAAHPEKARQMGRAGREIAVTKFDEARIARAFSALYTQVID